MPLRQPLIDKPVTALIQSQPHLGAKPASQRLGSRRQQLPIKPGCAARVDLPLERQVRTHQQAAAPSPLAVGPFACFDDGSRRCIVRLAQIGEAKIVRSPVHSFDDRIGLARQLIMKTATDQPSDDPAVLVFSMQR